MARLSGPRRLAMFASALWVAFWFVVYATSIFDWTGFFLFGILPLGLPWGIWWVVRGFGASRGAGRS